MGIQVLHISELSPPHYEVVIDRSRRSEAKQYLIEEGQGYFSCRPYPDRRTTRPGGYLSTMQTVFTLHVASDAVALKLKFS